MSNKWILGNRVRIKELGYCGTIRSVWQQARGTQVEVRYFHNGEAKEVYFYEDELEAL